MTVASYNLLTEPWLPVRKGSDTWSVGLRELFASAHEIEDLAVPVPPAASGLWRILYAITARLTDLDEEPGWLERQDGCLRRGHFDPQKIDGYFAEFSEAFDLFQPQRPWLQDPRLRTQCPKPSGVNKLVFDRPAGNTQVWFGHYTDGDPVPVPAAQAAWYLVAQLYYGASGRCTSREVDGQKLANSNAGPLRTAMSYHPVGRSLFESLIIGVPKPHTRSDEADLCPWERTELPDPLGAPHPITWPAGVLTGGFQHAILLVPTADGQAVTDAYVTWASRQPSGESRDPYVVRKLSKQGNWYKLHADGARSLWRDVYALLADREGSHQRPEIINSAKDHDEDGQQRIRAYGFDQDGQAKDRQWFTSITPPVLRWLAEHDEDAAWGAYDLHEAAERVGNSLVYLLKKAWQQATEVEDRNGPWAAKAETYYWARAEAIFWQHMRDRTWQDAKKTYKVLGHEAIDWATSGESHRQRFAAAIHTAHRRLASNRQKGEGS
ncbi:type I-E CRISPR-associated protein Cse1/CasA [Micromonospora sonneratiae]|uniref:Type I-E CRISPR-associated protein Cse1/CasA n=1 Tax=Micromonospora sonneratiae TaxID=1184706 RepID=A0ABW3YNG5_9ACTN